MSRRIGFTKSVKGEVKATECQFCKDNCESIQVYGGHNFKDLKGRVVCPNFLEKNRKPKYNVMQSLSKLITKMNKKNEEKHKQDLQIAEVKIGFDVHADDSSDDEFERLYPYVTFRSKLALQVPKSWTEWSDSDDE
jgi:hypothetical protein